jgi:hypothetical protein
MTITFTVTLWVYTIYGVLYHQIIFGHFHPCL